MSNNLHMKKTRKKVLLASSLVLAVSALGFAGYQIADNVKGANATSTDVNLMAEKYLAHGGLMPNTLKGEATIAASAAESPNLLKELKGATLPSRYNSREQSAIAGSPNGRVTKVENQASEGLCWAYSYTTVIESNILNTMSTYTELSPKQLDYTLVPASTGFSDSAPNKYYGYLASLGLPERSLGDGGNGFISSFVGASKIAPTSESGFWAKMKANDSSLASFSNYEDFIVDLDDVYSKKQRSSDVLDAAASEYTVTGWKAIDYFGYSNTEDTIPLINYTRSGAIEEIKNAIKNYGAVEIDSFFDTDNCMDIKREGDDVSVTIIDRGTEVCSPSTGHAMTIVGWDDNWAYKDSGLDKTGAFIIQNSWGEDGESIPTYLSYSSDMNYYIVDEVTKTPANGHVYDFTDRQNSSLVENDNEIIYSFRSNGREKLNKIAFTQSKYIGNNLSYKIYVSPTESGTDWVQAGVITTPYTGQYSIVPSSDLIVNGNFAVKVTYNTGDFDDEERALDIITVVSQDVTAPEPEDEGEEDDEGGDEEDVPGVIDVPDAGGDENIPTTPNTGSESKVKTFLKQNIAFMIPGFGAVVALAVAASRRKRHNLRRLWK